MSRTLWNSLLASSVTVGAALVVSEAVIGSLAIARSAPTKPITTETLEATEDRKAAIESESELTGPTVAELEGQTPVTNRKETLSGTDIETLIPRVDVKSAAAPTAFQASGLISEVNPKSKIQNRTKVYPYRHPYPMMPVSWNKLIFTPTKPTKTVLMPLNK